MVNKYYQKCKEKLRIEARERYQSISEMEKEKKRHYHRDQNKNPCEEENKKRVKYMRDYYLAHQ